MTYLSEEEKVFPEEFQLGLRLLGGQAGQFLYAGLQIFQLPTPVDDVLQRRTLFIFKRKEDEQTCSNLKKGRK